MRRLVPILVLALAAGCGRDFSLPPAPTNRPQFLGPLAGFYRLDAPTVAVGPAGKQADTTSPAGTVLVVQDLDMSNGGADPVVGSLSEVAMPTAEAAESQHAFTGTYVDRKLTATRVFTRKKLGGRTITEAAPFTATPIPGNDGLVLTFTTCPNETIPPLTMTARKVCDFEPQLSGTYAGHTGACGSIPGGSATYVGLGFRSLGSDGPALVIGMGYPDTSHVFWGLYDRFSGCGVAGESTPSGMAVADFKLTDDGKQLTLDLDEGPPGTLLGEDACQPNLAKCTAHFVGTRKDGSKSDACRPAANLGLVLRWKRDGGFLDVDAYVAGVDEITATSHLLSPTGDDRNLLRGWLTPADGSKPAVQGTVPGSGLPNVSLQFALNEPNPTRHDYRIEVWADVSPGAAVLTPVGAAMPACVLGAKL